MANSDITVKIGFYANGCGIMVRRPGSTDRTMAHQELHFESIEELLFLRDEVDRIVFEHKLGTATDGIVK